SALVTLESGSESAEMSGLVVDFLVLFQQFTRSPGPSLCTAKVRDPLARTAEPTWSWSPGRGHLAVVTWPWSPGRGHLVVVTGSPTSSAGALAFAVDELERLGLAEVDEVVLDRIGVGQLAEVGDQAAQLLDRDG